MTIMPTIVTMMMIILLSSTSTIIGNNNNNNHHSVDAFSPIPPISLSNPRFSCYDNLCTHREHNKLLNVDYLLMKFRRKPLSSSSSSSSSSFSSSKKIIKSDNCKRHNENSNTINKNHEKDIEISNNDNDTNCNPNHIAFICDGNSRWSIHNQNFMKNDNKKHNTNHQRTIWGHSKGAQNVIQLIKHIQQNYKSSINYITLYAFSTENWSRDANEIHDLWNVIETFTLQFYDYCKTAKMMMNIRVKVIGDLNDDRIPVSLRDLLYQLEFDTNHKSENVDDVFYVDDDTNATFDVHSQLSSSSSCLTICIAINYGGRKDIINASLKMADLISKGKILQINEHNNNKTDDSYDKEMEKIFSNLLYTSDIPDPDLVIRTGGEQRLSNFLIWNIAYSELYFTDTFWPDFNEKELDDAIEWYKGRERRFGGRRRK